MASIAHVSASDHSAVDEVIRLQQPAVLEGLADAWPDAPSSWPEFVDRFRDYPLGLAEQVPGTPLTVALSTLYEATVFQLDSLIEHNPGAAYYVNAIAAEPSIADALRRPDPVERHCWRSFRPLLYVGTGGGRCHLHQDSDYSNGLHLMAFGSKRVFFAPPASTPGLDPDFNLCGHPFEEWDLERQREYIARAGGCEATVETGQAFFIPRNWWHQVEYLDTSVALSWRFVRSPAHNLLSLLVRQPINEIVQLAEALDGEASRDWADSLLELLAVEREGRDEYSALVDFLEESYRTRVAEPARFTSTLGNHCGFDVLRALAKEEGSRPVLRTSQSEAFHFASARMDKEELDVAVEHALAREAHDPQRARRDFEAAGWGWTKPDDACAARRVLAGLLDHTWYP